MPEITMTTKILVARTLRLVVVGPVLFSSVVNARLLAKLALCAPQGQRYTNSIPCNDEVKTQILLVHGGDVRF